MPIYSVRGIDVDFPFEAYPWQIIYMDRVKEKLNAVEYNKFIGYMQALKKKELKLANVMQSIVQLVCGTERNHLLMGLKDFVPVKHRPAYEQCIKTRKRDA